MMGSSQVRVLFHQRAFKFAANINIISSTYQKHNLYLHSYRHGMLLYSASVVDLPANGIRHRSTLRLLLHALGPKCPVLDRGLHHLVSANNGCRADDNLPPAW